VTTTLHPLPLLEAVAVIETASIARGFVVLDAIAKKALVVVKHARPLTPGKFVIVFGGAVANVEEAFEAARSVAGSDVVDELILPGAHARLLAAIDGDGAPAVGEAVGIVETTTVAAAVKAADVALKATTVSILRMHLALNVGGKGWFTIAGELGDVEAALAAVRDQVVADRLVAIELIARPHVEVRGFIG
jgi:microcompartment protein CcmL/EutN